MRTTVLALLLAGTVLAGGADSAARLLQKEEFDKAAAAARKLVEADAQNVDAWLVLADALAGKAETLESWEKQGTYSEAVEQLEDALEQAPKDARIPLRLGRLNVTLAELMAVLTGMDNDVQGYYADAIRMFEAALERDPKSADAHYGIAYVTYASGKSVDKAREHLTRCLGLDKEHAEAHALQAEIFRQQKRYAEAAKSYEIARRLDDSDPLTCYYYASSLQGLGKLEEAKEAYRYTLQRHPDYAAAIRLGLLSLYEGNYAEAVPTLREWSTKIKKSYPLWLDLGYGLTQLPEPEHDEAYACFRKAEALRPRDADVTYWMGYVRESQDRGEEALRLYRRALEIDGGHVQAAGQYEGLIRGASNIEEVERLYEELIKLASGNGIVHNNYALILRNWAERRGAAQQESPPQAVRRRIKRSGEVYEMAAKLLPDDPQVQSDTGLLFEFYPCNRDDEKAERYFTNSLDKSQYLYRDAFDGLTRLCARSGDWELLLDYAEGVVGAIERGGIAIAPVGGSAPRELPRETPGLKARAERAIRAAQQHLEGKAE